MPVMNAHALALLLAATLATPASAAEPTGDPLIEQVRAEALTVSPLDRAVSMVETDNSGKTRHRAMHFLPEAGEGARWRLLSRNREPAGAAEVADFARSRAGELPRSYRSVADFLAEGVELVGRTERHAVYRVARLGPGSVMLGEEDISAALAAEIRIRTDVARPFVEDVRLEVAQSFKPRWLVKIRGGEGRIRFARATPEEPPAILLEEFRIEGSRPFGKIDFHRKFCFFGHRPAGRTPAGPTQVLADRDHPCREEGEALPAP